EYWDRFTCDDSESKISFSDLFRENSRHVPDFVFNADDLWHSHVGYFSDPGLSDRRLVNINLDAITLESRDASPHQTKTRRRSVGIYTMAQDTLNPSTSPSDAEGALRALDAMHTLLKSVLADVISEKAANLISLNAGSQP
ncbi:hypothetical protein V5F44_21340, partial [Xanthobacter sp. V2C-8]|uniref:hypothetical protein n=1 Tax=Xanthobacter albus TaxID=3119929 RepID=UPI0037283C46